MEKMDWDVCVWPSFSRSDRNDWTCAEADNSLSQTAATAARERPTVITSSMLTMFADDLEARGGPRERMQGGGGSCAFPIDMLRMYIEGRIRSQTKVPAFLDHLQMLNKLLVRS